MPYYKTSDGQMKYAATLSEIPSGMTKQSYQAQKEGELYGAGVTPKAAPAVVKDEVVVKKEEGVINPAPVRSATNEEAARSSTGSDSTKRIEDMYAAQQAARMAQLEAKRNAAISRLNQQSTTIKPYYEQQRNTLAGNVQQSRNKFSEFLANRGLSNSGAAAQAEISNQGRLQGGLAGLGQSEADAFSEIERQKGLANQDYSIDYDAVQQQIMADKSNALLNEQRYQDGIKQQLIRDARASDQQDYQDRFNAWLTQTNMGREDKRNAVLDTRYDSGITREDARNATLDARYNDELTYNRGRQEQSDFASSIKGLGSQMDYQGEINKVRDNNDPTDDWKIALLQRERENKLQGMLQTDLQTIGQYGNDYQAEINRRTNSQDTLDDRLIPFLKIAQAEKISQMQAGQATAQQTQQKNALELWKQMGVATPEIAAILGIPVGAQTSDYGVDRANINQSNAAASATLTNANINSEKFNAEKDAGLYDSENIALDKSIKRDQLESKQLNDITNRLDSLYVAKVFDPVQKGEVPKVVGDPATIRAAVLALKLPDNQTDYLLSRYGLPTN